MPHIRTITPSQIREMQRRGEVKAPREDAEPFDMPNGFWDDADLVDRQRKQSIHLRVDAHVLEYFKSGGKGHLTRMNAVLRAFVDAKKKQLHHEV